MLGFVSVGSGGALAAPVYDMSCMRIGISHVYSGWGDRAAGLFWGRLGGVLGCGFLARGKGLPPTGCALVMSSWSGCRGLCDGGGSCGVGGGGGGRGRKDAVVIYRCGGVEKGREEWRSGNLGGVWRVISGAGFAGSYGERKLAVEASIPS